MKSTHSQAPVLEPPSESEQRSPDPYPPKRSWLWALFGILILTVGGVGIWRWVAIAQGPSQAPKTERTARPRPVIAIPLEAGRGVQRVQLLGQVEAGESATIRSQTSGVVQQIGVSEGDRVNAGDVIAILDSIDQQLALSQAQAQLAQSQSQLAELERGTRPEVVAQLAAALQSAQAQEMQALDNLERTQELVEQGALSRRALVESQTTADIATGERLEAAAELAEAQAGSTAEELAAQRASVAAAQAAVEQARLSLQRTQIKAVSDGVVRSRQVSVGDYVDSADPIVTLIDSEVVDIFLEIPESLTGQVAPGFSVELTARALPNWRTQATIAGVVPIADTASRRQTVRIRLNNPPAELVPGIAIQAALEIPNPTEGFIVPRDALTRRDQQWWVFLVNQDTVQQIAVNLITDMGETVLIASENLRPGQSIVLKGGDALADGAMVKVVNE
ncbi:MAG: efflux RND transporter periplasmic adaptor subunit [Leptolyngbyaceae cyanobacterium MO_188.B28]|nr:efflux RND transporter periplasmic adaptor subunit [Leptolyngbyaceae cyanobacterium MO_188.B28]